VSPVSYELGFYIPEDGTLHSHRRENFKYYIIMVEVSSAETTADYVLEGRSLISGNGKKLLFHRSDQVGCGLQSSCCTWCMSAIHTA
jgi:hypothetical protein